MLLAFNNDQKNIIIATINVLLSESSARLHFWFCVMAGMIFLGSENDAKTKRFE
jgi:hypothetical protein